MTGSLVVTADEEGNWTALTEEVRLVAHPSAGRGCATSIRRPGQPKTGTPARTSRQFGTKKSAGSIAPLACAQSISSWRISCWAL